jgi:SAM-dependent methyltransferase
MNASLSGLETEYTGERVVPGATPEMTFRESQMRYAFAAQFVRGRRVVDIASGSGIGTEFLQRAGAQPCIGIDLDHAALRYAGSRFGLRQLAACDASRLCLAPESVDVMVSFETIEHVADPAIFLSECWRVLGFGGLLICSTPNREITRWDPANAFHVAEMRTADFAQKVMNVFRDCRLYGQGAVDYPFYVARRKIGGTLERLGLKQWARRRLRLPVDPVCEEIEFSDAHQDERFRVLSPLPRWPNKPRYLIAVARKLKWATAKPAPRHCRP